MYQSITIIGRLGRDPEMRYLPNGDPVTSFSAATDREWKNQQGEKVKETTWFRVSVFGKQAEACNQYLSKGKMVLVEGRLVPDKASGGPKVFTKQDGTASASFELAAATVRFLSPRDEGAHAAEGDSGAVTPTDGGSDIPF